ncbi:hypothetical protein ACVC7V_07455 [Hydrogenophaga sp. A37]|uniref:hypothetical protein n=1 Tax=Hydrogenophaga sp. A37 TaxID=1945864 RepID=UPI0015C53E0E|nr:hypothetical protein [Hydrogenophaga sp. A37]
MDHLDERWRAGAVATNTHQNLRARKNHKQKAETAATRAASRFNSPPMNRISRFGR